MGFKRKVLPDSLEGEALTRAMAGIGMRFAVDAAEDPNIEDTLTAVSVEGMVGDDLRVLSVLVTWLQVHHSWVNADRLIRCVSCEDSDRVRAFWAAIAAFLRKDRRFVRMEALYTGNPVELLKVGNSFQVARKGEDDRFRESPLIVPADTLRERSSDVFSPAELARLHGTYRTRVLMGPSYRADMWAALTKDPTLSAADLARRTYGSFATAWQVKTEFAILAA